MAEAPEIVNDKNVQEETLEENSEVTLFTTQHFTLNEPFDFWNNVLKKPRLILAPMVDQSELAFRLMVRKYGVECTYSPMYHSANFVRDPRYRRECLQVARNEDFPLFIQFCGNDPESFAESAKLAEDHCEAIDLNLGCPQMIAKRGHYGSFLQDEWKLIYDMIKKATRMCKKPITAKMRVFADIDKTVQYAKMIQSAGATVVAVHGRTREQKGADTGMASWEHIKAVKDALNVPVIANGNVQCLEDALECLKATGVDGVMSAEGILHNPSIYTGKPITVWQALREYTEIARKHPPTTFSYVRGHVFKFLHHLLVLPEHSNIRQIVAKTHSYDALIEVATVLEEHYKSQANGFKVDECQLEPKEYPIWCCKPYFRPPPTIFNSRVAREEAGEELPEMKQGEKRPISKRQLKKLVKISHSKKFKQTHSSLDEVTIEEKKQLIAEQSKPAYLDFCIKNDCQNPRGVRCVHTLCKACCRGKTYEEKLNCKGHKFNFMGRPKSEEKGEELQEQASQVVMVKSSS